VIAISPVLIMLLVGSLSFFLVEVFYRGELIAGVRWVVFWFVIAIVCVSRVGIEQGAAQATLYGAALTGATWLYLLQTHPAYLLGLVLLGTAWWCANKLTRNCTLVDDDEDATGQGLLQAAAETPPEAELTALKPKKRSKPKQTPGLSVVYFSLAALPLFGIGHVLLAAEEQRSRRVGFTLLVLYLAAALGLLVTTSFLGLRRYLRQRLIMMPGDIAWAWVKLGAMMIVLVLALTLFLPRPGADYTWKTLAYQIDHHLEKASEYASSRNPRGEGEGKPGNETGRDAEQGSGLEARDAAEPQPTDPGSDTSAQTQSGQPHPSGPKRDGVSQPTATPPLAPPGQGLHQLLRGLFIAAIVIGVMWWLIRHRQLVVEFLRSIIDALRQFLRSLLAGIQLPLRRLPAGEAAPRVKPGLFKSYTNPFVTGKDKAWSPEQLVIYTYQAVQAWAADQGLRGEPQQTPREVCATLSEQFPQSSEELRSLALFYTHAVFGTAVPGSYEPEPLRRLWQQISEP
jgi:hypothetical protein